MKTSAKELRTLVMDNSLELGRLTEKQLGKEDYRELTKLYRNALDAITEWAAKDYNHTSVNGDDKASFDAVKAILSLFATDESRIIIDEASMRTIRDCATKPQRMYSEKYKKAEKARSSQQKTAIERYEDLLTLGVEKSDEYDVIALIKGIKDSGEIADELKFFIDDVRASEVVTSVGTTDMLTMFENSLATLVVRTKAVENIKSAGKWTWRRIAPVDGNGEPKVFADLVENYIADCLIDGRNIKTSKGIRDEAKARRDEAKKAKLAEAETVTE